MLEGNESWLNVRHGIGNGGDVIACFREGLLHLRQHLTWCRSHLAVLIIQQAAVPDRYGLHLQYDRLAIKQLSGSLLVRAEHAALFHQIGCLVNDIREARVHVHKRIQLRYAAGRFCFGDPGKVMPRVLQASTNGLGRLSPIQVQQVTGYRVQPGLPLIKLLAKSRVCHSPLCVSVSTLHSARHALVMSSYRGRSRNRVHIPTISSSPAATGVMSPGFNATPLRVVPFAEPSSRAATLPSACRSSFNWRCDTPGSSMSISGKIFLASDLRPTKVSSKSSGNTSSGAFGGHFLRISSSSANDGSVTTMTFRRGARAAGALPAAATADTASSAKGALSAAMAKFD